MYLSTTLLSAATAFTSLALAAPYPAATGYPSATWTNGTGHPYGPGSHSPGSYINSGIQPGSKGPGGYGPGGPGSHIGPAGPGGPGGPGSCPIAPGAFCMSDDDAQDAADIFRLLIQDYSDELALAALTEDFVDYSSAVNIIINGGGEEPMYLPGPTFSGRQEFMDGQGSQPKIPFKQLKVWHGCDHVSMRWLTKRSAKGQATETDDLVSLDYSCIIHEGDF